MLMDPAIIIIVFSMLSPCYLHIYKSAKVYPRCHCYMWAHRPPAVWSRSCSWVWLLNLLPGTWCYPTGHPPCQETHLWQLRCNLGKILEKIGLSFIRLADLKKRSILRKFNHAVKKMIFSSKYFYLVPKGSWFFEPLGPKWKYSEEKIHLFYRVIKVQISGGLLTDYLSK